MSVEHYYIVIVGSGPAGMGAAGVIQKNSLLASRTLIIDKGPSLAERVCPARQRRTCRECNPCNVLSGVGGAGPFTDGKICLFPQRLNEFFPGYSIDGENEGIEKKVTIILKEYKIYG